MKTKATWVAAIACLTFGVTTCGAYPPDQNLGGGAFEAEAAAIVQPTEGLHYTIIETFKGSLKVGETISVPSLILKSFLYGRGRGPGEPVETTPSTRILLFLERTPKDANVWQVVSDGYCYFWVDDPSEIGKLRTIATDALVHYQAWKNATEILEPENRVAALWPFLFRENGTACSRQTLKEMLAIRSVSASYIAQRFETLNHDQKMSLLQILGSFGGVPLHDLLLRYLTGIRNDYDALKVTATDVPMKSEVSNKLPDQVKNLSGEIYYGLDSLAGFHDVADLPMIREMGRWSADRGLSQTCEAALNAFAAMPARENLPVVEYIWKGLAAKYGNANASFQAHIFRAIDAHKYPESVPLLVRLLDAPDLKGEVRSALRTIVGHYLGSNPQPWLDWYEKQKP